jgi:hypothetical protein
MLQKGGILAEILGAWGGLRAIVAESILGSRLRPRL